MVVKNRLVFKDAGVYERYLENFQSKPSIISEDKFLDSKEETLGFVSLRKEFASLNRNARNGSESTCAPSDPHLASLLNPQGMVQIGKWIFKINLCNKRCYVLDANDATDALLHEMAKQQPKNAKISFYSTEEDVIDLLMAGVRGKNSLSNSGEKTLSIFGEDDKDVEGPVYYDGMKVYPGDDRGKIKGKVCYQAAGIYFSLIAKFKYMEKFGEIYWEAGAPKCIEYTMIKYQPKNRSEEVKTPRGNDCEYNGEVQYRPYEAMRRLDRYHYEVRFKLGAGYTEPAGVLKGY